MNDIVTHKVMISLEVVQVGDENSNQSKVHEDQILKELDLSPMAEKYSNLQNR